MTNEERERLREIIDAADQLFIAAGSLFYGTGHRTPADIDAAWDRLFALRWNHNMDDAPREEFALLSCRRIGAVVGIRYSDQPDLWFADGEPVYPTAWMPLPPVKEVV